MTATVQLCRVNPGINPIAIVEAHEQAYDSLCEEFYGGEIQRSEGEFRKRARQLLDDFGFDQNHLLTCVHPLEAKPSTRHPEHPFRLDYWFSGPTARSLFNVVYRHTGEFLSHLFNTGNFYETPDWARVVSEVSRIRALLKDSYRGVDVYETSPNPFRDTPEVLRDSGQALNFFLSQEFELENQVSGAIFEEPLALRAVFHGYSSYMPESPATYLVYDWTEAHLQWYLDGLDVIQEQAEFVLSQPDPENYILQWNRDDGLEILE